MKNGQPITQKDFPQIEAAAKSFQLNQAIFDELNYYGEFGEVLGKHPKLWKLKLEQDVSLYDELEAFSRRATLRANISRDNKKLEKMKPGPGKDEFAKKIERYVLERDLIDSKFDFKRRKK
ncbi:hypothetical protein [Salinimicrobium sp. WS361]|uniref:hypothetical protein n=1 Tax=Salinimicrobium sp. WS361 TaxID=3425123 RepID=UPI003D6E3368